ncbi:protocadherin-9-like isoform X1 [Pecten maximus]|uniref:protocadherin-9-like isoform X1 n=1 Tax=Pecten maximus TaxID=6579 RepID=UPI001458347A|nr:protocadherin-9-like isoform X1 [Pecten maximus]XP_033742377.1 protocadherin-9-like isoform X1 [Pecten maximus]XP_033742378.1 protocadherin-9-like isoform X1 [Pecten maximus]XP_033742379.1 protocadherin-9-like isoform X1 [Pecten maximus]
MKPVLAFLLLSGLFCGTLSQNAVIRFTMSEELPTSTLVGNIAEKSGMRNNYTTEEFNSIRYKFLDQSVMQTRFTINDVSGNLSTSVVLDRESICGYKEICILAFDVAAYSNLITLFEILSVEVELTDENDNIPTFPESNVTFHMLESSVIGSTISLDYATDLDSTRLNSIKSYEIVPEDFGVFGLNVTTKPDGGFQLRLVLLQYLDRETMNHYQFYVIAKDGGIKQNIGTMTVNIMVTDYNDHSPEFVQPMYNVTVAEGVAIQTSILTLSATDKDIGENARITYGFSSRQSDLDIITSLFEIESATGVVKVIGDLVYETGKVHKFYVEASDHGDQPRVTQTTIYVTILDVGNNPPTVSINFLSSGNAGLVNVSESANLKTVIAHVNVIDTDSGPNGRVDCTISGNNFELSPVGDKGFIVRVNRSLDRETREVQNISVVCRDHGSPVLSSSLHFLVRILDENDNEPVFNQDTYFAFVEENSKIGAMIKQVGATDIDVGRNAVVYYYLTDDAQGRFAINSNSGVITTYTHFDREQRNHYEFTVLAVDSGNPPMTGSATVVLTVTDINDNYPTFDGASFQFFVQENLAVDAYVGTLSANDDDEGVNQEVMFSISPSYTNRVPFYVMPDGAIKTNIRLDRETKSVYTFEVEVTDKGSPPLSTATNVIIHVTDDNDQAPVIQFPNKGNNSVSVSFLVPIGTTITKVLAYDLDEEGPNSRLTYSIRSGNNHDIFAIGQTSGNIYLKRAYSLESDEKFILEISVKDNALHPKETVHQLEIILKYSNESSTSLVPKTGNTNVIISIVVVAFTFVISAAIITTICILRRHDKKLEMKHSEKMFDKPEVAANDKTKKGDLTYKVDDVMDTPKKKKKEVSFSLDEAYGSMQHDFTGTTELNIADPLEDGMYPSQSNKQMQNLQLHKHHLQAHDKQKNIMAQPLFDNLSDTSGETANSDSGRGGSDVDLSCQMSMQDELKTFTFNYFNKKPKSSTPSTSSSVSQPSNHNKNRTHGNSENHGHYGQKHYNGSVDVFHTGSEFPRDKVDSRVGTDNFSKDSSKKGGHRSKSKSEKWFPSYV